MSHTSDLASSLSPTAPLLALQGLAKSYGPQRALDGLSLSVPAGQFVALLGPNGAGKSTLFQLLTGLFVADSGEARVAGHSLRSAAVPALARIGVVFQQMSLDLDLSVRRNLQFHADLHGLPRALARQRMAQGCAAFGPDFASDEALARPVRALSGGNRRKVELVRALLHEPALLLMDEPTVGLDPRSRRELLAAVRAEVAARACSVLWATHLVEEAEAADRVLVLHKGRLLADGPPAEVARQLSLASGQGGADAASLSLEEAFIRATA